MKKRYIILLFVIGMIVLSAVPFLSPVRPFIQLPGEIWPGTKDWPFIGTVLGGMTNTFASALFAWIIVIILALVLRAGSRTADEVPTGFYNFFEMLIEGAYNFAENIAGPKVKDFFPWFMSFILIILITNWMGLIPGWDSVGFWEHKPHFFAEQEIKVIEDGLAEAEADGEVEDYLAGLEARFGFEMHLEDGHLSHETEEEILHELEHEFDEENKGDLRVGSLLIRKSNATDDAELEEDNKGRPVGYSKEAADWTIVPIFRPGATDLNYTLAFALIAMVMVQYYGFKYLGARDYLAKFFPFIGKGFGAQVAKNPIKAIDPVVGFLELISEISKIISFAFRLLGNLFAGMVLLFVMAFLLPIANMAFFGLEFFVGLIQAAVFGLLMLIFMVSATESHGHGDDDHH
ncbi:F0F1 ATP synthase subunit A [Candidatus Leptofilum sp.]|uniref:F0F1 ATP synthase subunit A n=1 Tax=Candidatus Leptofilum sp. TaxID=3241576 RepID=UPI003B5CE0A6